MLDLVFSKPHTFDLFGMASGCKRTATESMRGDQEGDALTDVYIPSFKALSGRIGTTRDAIPSTSRSRLANSTVFTNHLSAVLAMLARGRDRPLPLGWWRTPSNLTMDCKHSQIMAVRTVLPARRNTDLSPCARIEANDNSQLRP